MNENIMLQHQIKVNKVLLSILWGCLVVNSGAMVITKETSSRTILIPLFGLLVISTVLYVKKKSLFITSYFLLGSMFTFLLIQYHQSVEVIKNYMIFLLLFVIILSAMYFNIKLWLRCQK